jgi:hypothetical protein
MSKFKVGDKVKIVYTCDNQGKIGTIKEVNPTGEKLIQLDNGAEDRFTFDTSLELVEEIPQKIVVQCDTLEEWKGVLDKQFREGKTWSGKESGYIEDRFNAYNPIAINISHNEYLSYSSSSFWVGEGYSIISAKEYLKGEILSIKKTTGAPILILDKSGMITIGDVFLSLDKSYLVDYPLNGEIIIKKSKTNKNKIMENIVKFAKNLSLSKEEKLLREVGIKNEVGKYTNEALSIVCDLEAQETGYAGYEELCDETDHENCVSVFEIARMFKKFETKLLEIAKAKKEEEKSATKK